LAPGEQPVPESPFMIEPPTPAHCGTPRHPGMGGAWEFVGHRDGNVSKVIEGRTFQ